MSLRRKILLPILALLLLVPSGALYVVATTEWGLKLVVSRLGKAGPVTITAGTVTGTLVDGFTVDRLRVQHRLSDVTIEHASGRIELLPLMILQRVTLPEVKVAHVSVVMQRDLEDRPKREARFLPALMRIDTDALHVDAADITLLSGRVVPLRKIDAAVTVYPKQIYVRSARADHELVHIEATGQVQAARPLGLEGETELSWSLEGQPDWLILAKFDGDLAKLPITGSVQKPFHARFDGAATTLNKGWNFAGHAKVQDLDLQPFGAGNALGIISGELDITSVANAFTARGRLTPPGLNAGAFGVDLRGSYSQKVVTIQGATVTHASGARATTHGDITIVKGGPVLALAGDWSRFRWPLVSAAPAFVSTQGTYTLRGVKPWSVQLEGDVIAAEQPAMPAKLRGLLSGESLQIDDATVGALGGTATFTGEARWKPAESWRIAGRMRNLDTARLREDLPGAVSFDFSANGAPFGAEGSLDFSAERLSGKLRGQNISGKGQVARAAGSKDWRFRGVDASLGRTRVQLDGRLGEQSDLTFAVNADDLSLFDPDARGRVTASGHYAGTREVPQLQVKAQGSNFEWGEYKVATLNADVDIDMRPNGHAQGHVDALQLTIGSRTLAKAIVDLSGSRESQRLTLAVDAAPYTSTLVAQGAMKDGLWQGVLQNLNIQDARDLKLALEAPATLALNLEQQQLGQTCLKGAAERLCVTGQRKTDGTWNGTLTADSIPLRAFTAGLTQDIDYDGTINFRAELSGNSKDLPVGTFRGQLQQALLRHRLANGRDERMSLGSGTVNGTATTTGFTMQVGLDAGTAGNITGELNGDRNAGDWRNFPIRGTLNANTDGLALLDIYVGGIDKASGRLITKVDIGGTLGAPTVQGLLQLRDASIDIYQVNLSMRELSLDANFSRESLDISGSSRLGSCTQRAAPDDCRAKFNGKLTWKGGEPYGNLHVGGTRLRVVDVPEARIDASPDLDFRIDGHRIRATGKVDVPYAQLEPADLTKVVLASSDEKIVGTQELDPAQRWLVAYDIQVALGDEVHIESLGLKARLGGGITVRSDEAGDVRGEGELSIAEGGKFAYLGRQFDIARGRLIYRNVPLADPAVDLRAQKVYPDVTAGMNVRGPLRSPVVTFFSDPALPRSQVESLILSGSLESAQANRSGAARNAIITQGLSIAAQRMSSQIGVDDVGLETDMKNDTSVVLGKYLTPRLYVSYGISLAEAINTLKMRFTLGDRWTIKTEAGKERSADIVYTIKK
jgi:translocation and assembly module TamB